MCVGLVSVGETDHVDTNGTSEALVPFASTPSRPNSKTPPNSTLCKGVLVVVLGWEGVALVRGDAVAAALAAIDARVGRCCARRMNEVELTGVAVRQELRILIVNAHDKLQLMLIYLKRL